MNVQKNEMQSDRERRDSAPHGVMRKPYRIPRLTRVGELNMLTGAGSRVDAGNSSIVARKLILPSDPTR